MQLQCDIPWGRPSELVFSGSEREVDVFYAWLCFWANKEYTVWLEEQRRVDQWEDQRVAKIREAESRLLWGYLVDDLEERYRAEDNEKQMMRKRQRQAKRGELKERLAESLAYGLRLYFPQFELSA